MIVSPVAITRRRTALTTCRVTRHQNRARAVYRFLRRSGLREDEARYVVVQLLVVGISAEVELR